MSLWRVIALGIIAWDTLLHAIGLVYADMIGITDLPWLLYPTFNTREAYDLFWMLAHAYAFVVLVEPTWRRASP